LGGSGRLWLSGWLGSRFFFRFGLFGRRLGFGGFLLPFFGTRFFQQLFQLGNGLGGSGLFFFLFGGSGRRLFLGNRGRCLL
jgi:hypothetical protein